MTARRLLARATQNETLNFVLTNRLPRRLATRLVGRISKSENPVIKGVSIGLWRIFTDIDLSDAKVTRFRSLHDCFTRELREGARTVDPDPKTLTSPCDGIVVAAGTISGTELLQVKGSHYTLEELAGSSDIPDTFRDGTFVTLRLTSAMYHRFHAPFAGEVGKVRYIPGDVWNVNPTALKRVERLYCRNERAVIDMQLRDGARIALIPVAAILVAGLKLRFLAFDRTPDPVDYACFAKLDKGQEMGWFEHGSTIIVLAPKGWRLAPGVADGRTMRMGEALILAP